ncbi:MAG TPA: response regulator [Candidatus Margulisiibacteriota bacterium]|nr:response regulator [Candidatus Margulisiibacteriota bacterium]
MENKDTVVLVVDDEADFRQLMTFWLEGKGYYVITADNGQNAIKQIKEKNPAIVFMDLRMPVMDGIEAIKRIREFNKDIPLIIISAYVDDPKVKEAIVHGISGVFYKGKDFEEGLSLLEVALRTHKQLKK